MGKDKVIVLRGTLDWAKIVGDARPHTGNPKYDKGPYWSVDLTPDAESRKKIKEAGFDNKLREPNIDNEKEHRLESYLSLKVLENRSDGKKNEAPKIKNLEGQPWDGRLIGNGTVADVKIRVVDYGKGIDKGAYLQAVRILDHVPYEIEEFAPLSEDDKYFAAKPEQTEKDIEEDDLNDDVPF